MTTNTGIGAAAAPYPALDVYCSPQKYAGLGRDFRRSAWRHLEEGDLPQASNKAWGLVAETVKAVSAQHGGIIHAHRSIWMVVREPARVAGDAGDAETQQWINSSFPVARSLHSNCYEDEAEDDDVRAGLRQCELLSERLYELFRPDGSGGDGG